MVATKDSIAKTTIDLNRVVQACGLTVSIPTTEFLIAGKCVTQSDLDPIHIGGSAIESVHHPLSLLECPMLQQF